MSCDDYIQIYLEADLPGWRHMIVLGRGRKWTTLYYPSTGERVQLLNATFDRAPKAPAKLRKGKVLERIRHAQDLYGTLETKIGKEAARDAVKIIKAA